MVRANPSPSPRPSPSPSPSPNDEPAVGGRHEEVGVREEGHDVHAHGQRGRRPARALAQQHALQTEGEVAQKVDRAHLRGRARARVRVRS